MFASPYNNSMAFPPRDRFFLFSTHLFSQLKVSIFFCNWDTRSFSEIERWLSELSKELISRLVEQQEGEGQAPSKLTVSFAALQQVCT